MQRVCLYKVKRCCISIKCQRMTLICFKSYEYEFIVCRQSLLVGIPGKVNLQKYFHAMFWDKTRLLFAYI